MRLDIRVSSTSFFHPSNMIAHCQSSCKVSPISLLIHLLQVLSLRRQNNQPTVQTNRSRCLNLKVHVSIFLIVLSLNLILPLLTDPAVNILLPNIAPRPSTKPCDCNCDTGLVTPYDIQVHFPLPSTNLDKLESGHRKRCNFQSSGTPLFNIRHYYQECRWLRFLIQLLGHHQQ